MRAILAQLDLPGLGREGPDDLRSLLRGFFVVFGIGFAVAVVGHVIRSRALQAGGIALVMLATLLFMVAVFSHG
ncbi:MAG: hypothetical protein ACR2GL_00245 [Thermoleophilaceae bacterium]